MRVRRLRHRVVDERGQYRQHADADEYQFDLRTHDGIRPSQGPVTERRDPVHPAEDVVGKKRPG